MLVLSRKSGEKLVIGEQIEITVTRIDKGRVQLGIDAPKCVRIRRNELPGAGEYITVGNVEFDTLGPIPFNETLLSRFSRHSEGASSD